MVIFNLKLVRKGQIDPPKDLEPFWVLEIWKMSGFSFKMVASKGVILQSRGGILPSRGGILPSKGGILPSRGGGILPSRGGILNVFGNLKLEGAGGCLLSFLKKWGFNRTRRQIRNFGFLGPWKGSKLPVLGSKWPILASKCRFWIENRRF